MRSVQSSRLALFTFSLASALAAGAAAAPRASSWAAGPEAGAAGRFNRVATLPNFLNDVDPSGATVAEIIAANASGDTLVYTDGLLEEVGFLDITDRAPRRRSASSAWAVSPRRWRCSARIWRSWRSTRASRSCCRAATSR